MGIWPLFSSAKQLNFRFVITQQSVYNEMKIIFEYSCFRFSIDAAFIIFNKTHF